MADDPSQLKTLELLYEEVVRESDRLRSARGAFSRQLGPLPVAGGLVLGIFTSFGNHPHRVTTWVAVGVFAFSAVLSMAASGIAPYRRLRSQKVYEQNKNKPDSQWRRPELQGAMETGKVLTATSVLREEAWLRERIKLERSLYGPPARQPKRGDLLRRLWDVRLLWDDTEITTLQQAFEIERYAVFIVQLLFVAEIALLFAGT
jgi:hypothetical protein